jgi:hypothetical protein
MATHCLPVPGSPPLHPAHPMPVCHLQPFRCLPTLIVPFLYRIGYPASVCLPSLFPHSLCTLALCLPSSSLLDIYISTHCLVGASALYKCMGSVHVRDRGTGARTRAPMIARRQAEDSFIVLARYLCTARDVLRAY